jgi:hypothetical protein
MEIFRRVAAIACRRSAPAAGDGGDRGREPGLPRHLRHLATVFDYSRWISNWAVCLFLILLAVRDLPAVHPVPPIPTEDRKTRIVGWIVTLLPRVGVVRPF